MRAGQETPPAESAVRYRLRQTFTYEYDGPARDLVHRLVVLPPPVHGDQRRVSGSVAVSDTTADVRWHTDDFGNRHCLVRIAEVPARLELHVSAVVERGESARVPAPRRGVVPAPTAASGALTTTFCQATELTAADAEIAQLAVDHLVPGDVLATADAYCGLVQQRISYGFDATNVNTTAAEALRGGTGVCQDQAHLMLALCRASGLAARYVSGHLVGQGGTHAWTEVLLPDGTAVAFDPCHGRRTDRRYVTIAVGRDYRDVPPTSGRYDGFAKGRLTTSRMLGAEPVA